MKCLSVRTQYAYLLCLGIKDIENRSWQTKYRGELYIHSSGKYLYKEIDIDLWPKSLVEIIKNKNYDKKPAWLEKLDKFYDEKLLPFYNNQIYKKNNKYFLINTAIIGKVNLVNIIKNSESAWAEENQYHWIFDNAALFKDPIYPVMGKLGIWEINI